MKSELHSFFMKKTCMVIGTFGKRFEGVGTGNGGISIVAGNCRVRESKGVGTLRVPWYFYPCWREIEGPTEPRTAYGVCLNLLLI